MASEQGGMSPHHEGMIPVESLDVSQRGDVHKLHGGAVGLLGVLFLTVTGAAPISAMLFNTPLSVGYGNGIGTPAGFAFATLILTIFSVGYVAMSRKVTAAGGFYSFISHGLGRELGMASGLAMVVAYSVFEASLCGGFAYFAVAKLAQYGYHVSWYWPALFMVALISILAYFDVHISARVLGLALISEVAFLLIFDLVVFAQGGENVQAGAINPINAFKDLPASGSVAAGAWAVGVFFAFWSWVGFEMAPNYGEESKDPKRIVPRAMYISVIGLGVFYTITSWAALSGYVSTHAAAVQATTNAYLFFLAPAKQFGNEFLRDALSYLIITGSFACGMAFHNTTARYFYSLGREKVLPAQLGRTHEKHKSPFIASTTQSVIAGLIVIAFALFATTAAGSDSATSIAYVQLYGLMAFMGVVLILFIQALVSVAIWNYFRTHHPSEHHIWNHTLAPLISVIGQAVVLFIAIRKIDFLGAGYHYAWYLVIIDVLVFAGGIAYALFLKSANRAKYETIGRMVHEGL
ncbi:MAG TPA: APC family permease [Gaiellales bacterium]|nr:APC family permease [Gaiellales bacterium]